MTDIPAVTPFVWYATLALIGGLLAFDFFFHVRKAHVPTLREATLWSGIYIALALLFGIGVLAFGGSEMGQEYFAGYVTEKALSVDNLFVFLVIFASFRVPREDQQKALLFGIVFSLIARGAFIAIGAALIETFSWVFYIFGLILLFTAGHLLSPQDEDEDRADNIMIRLARRMFHTSPHYDRDRLFTMVDGRRVMTPMLLVMAAIAGSDILFALDSIPAIFGLTESAYVVFTATAFSLMGLRQLYFLIDGLLDRLVYLSYGLAAILGFIGVKLVLHALHENTLPFINDGQPVNVVEISTGLSLSVICAVLAVTVLASIFSPRGKALAAINNARRYATEYMGLDPQADPAGREEAYARMVAAEQDLERIEPRYRAMIKDPEGLAATLRQAHSQHDSLGG